MSAKKTVAVIGASGYAGATAVQLLMRHPGVELVRATSRSFAGEKLGAAVPGVDSDLELIADPDPGDAEIVVVALPHGMTAGLAGGWGAAGQTGSELGASFLLQEPGPYPARGGAVHPASASLA